MNMKTSRDIVAQPPPLEIPAQRSRRRVALLVGVNGYQPESKLTPLKYAERDAQVMARELHACGFKVILLLGRAATQLQVQSALERCGQLGGSLFMFFFAGHGRMAKGGYHLYPYNSKSTGVGALSFESLAREWHTREFGFESVFAILDACRSELGGRGGGEPLSAATCSHLVEATRGPKRLEILFGCQEGQVCYEEDELRHGVLTASLLPAFGQFPDFLTTQTFAAAANDQMDRWSQQDKGHHGRVQRLQLYADPSLEDPLTLVDREVGLASLVRLPRPLVAAHQRVRHIGVAGPSLPDVPGVAPARAALHEHPAP